MMKDIAKYLYEMGHLKNVERSGWRMIGISNPESVAEHSFRVAILGYILAYLEEVDPEKVAIICLFHDAHETRITDLHRLAKRYIKLGEKERLAITEQAERLPSSIADRIVSLMDEYEDKMSPESRIAHDADALECLIQAREYQKQGYDTQEWIDNSYNILKTETARSIADACLAVEPREWWQGLKILE